MWLEFDVLCIRRLNYSYLWHNHILNMPLIRNENSFKGYFIFEGRRYCFELRMMNKPSKNQASFKLDWRLKKLLGSSLHIFLENTKFHDAAQFYSQFSECIERFKKTLKRYENWLTNPTSICALVKTLKEEIHITKKYLQNLSMENETLEIKVIDAQQRIHKAILRLSEFYPRDPLKLVYHDLPLGENNNFSDNLHSVLIFSISQFCEKFAGLVSDLQEFWNTVALLDSQCFVLDPPNPSFKDTIRRIKLTGTLSVLLQFNPFLVRQRPNIKLFGCPSEVNHYKTILQKNLMNNVWENEEDVLYNLSNILEINIPNKVLAEENDYSNSFQEEECAICFTWRLSNEIPNEMCEKKTCKSIYHSTCLFKYLSSFPRNQNYFGKIQGECPNCSSVMSCHVPQFSD